jgi:hypothetical protein
MTRHLLTVWNPSYADSIMDAHLEVLLDWAERHRDGNSEAEDRYVWWAKLKSPNRQQPLPHTSEILALQEQIERGEETHLYLTDYRSLYVGHLEEIDGTDFRAEYPDEGLSRTLRGSVRRQGALGDEAGRSWLGRTSAVSGA